MRIICLVTLFAVLLVGGCATSKGESFIRADYDFSKIDKVAVLEVSGAVHGEAAKDQIGDFFVMELLKKGYTPVERAKVQSLLKEQDFQTSDLTSSENAARAGHILNVPAVLLVNIPTYDEEFSMTAKMIEVESGEILWTGFGTGRTGKTFATIAGAIGGAAAGAVIGDAVGDSGIAGGVAGAVAGQALSPQQAEQLQKIIKEKVCADLPTRPGVL
ncbi:MAG: CsgG/HfaB family protein [Planctomycetota bacterium]